LSNKSTDGAVSGDGEYPVFTRRVVHGSPCGRWGCILALERRQLLHWNGDHVVSDKLSKPRDPASHLRSQGALRQRVVRDKTKQSKADRSKAKTDLKKESKE